MATAITEGVKVSVVTQYEADYSRPSHQHYVFSYHISIENHSSYTLQLLRRHWFIYDAHGGIAEVEGEGVIGQQPILSQAETHEYSSGCTLRTPIGKMKGTYLFERLIDGTRFKVDIPEFVMIVPYLAN